MSRKKTEPRVVSGGPRPGFAPSGEALAPQQNVVVGPVSIGNSRRLVVIAGTCAMESESLLRRVGRELKAILSPLGVPFILKCSFDKANRTSVRAFRGRGMLKGLKSIRKVSRELKVPVVTDVHEPAQAALAAPYVDLLQIPAFLCRQTDLLLACGRTGKAVNIKKGQFLAPWDMKNAVEKIESTGNRRLMLTERGASYGYGNLVVDMRSLEIMKALGYPVIFDITHSLQLPGALGSATGGQREFAPALGRAATAVGIAGVSFETHPDPKRAKSDGPNSIRLCDVRSLVLQLERIDGIIKNGVNDQ